jgi:ribosomal protein S18 acetylase RimI-like enzyme
MKHVLDNPAFNALNTGNKNLANGTAHIKFFDGAVSSFVGFNENTDANFEQLATLLPPDRTAIIVSPQPLDIPSPWKLIFHADGYQMVYKGGVKPVNESTLVVLTDDHIPQMLALTQLTNPGPFAQRTIDFGHYRGIFDGDQLVAMAGQRMNPLPYAEISAVCTHPNYLGRGYAKQLLQQQINRIITEGNIPFLHTRCDNERAVKIYESMGFETRTMVWFYVIGR